MEAATATPAQDQEEFAPLDRVKRQFLDYQSAKTEEIKEQRQARLYYHASQWTKSQLAELKKRGQPPVTTPIFARKVNGFVGLVERLRRDPKAYPRTGNEEQSAELATAALRYALDEQQWTARSPIVTLHAAVDAIGGIELGLTPGDSGQPGDFDIEIDYVEPDTFYYDPRSMRFDFSDARFMGVSKWVDLDLAKEMFPDKAESLSSANMQSQDYIIDSDREIKWFNNSLKQVRLVEHWYRKGKKWYWCFFCGSEKLSEGRSFLQDEKKADICRFIMWCAFIDQDGDRYSFHRNMKSLIDEVNQRNSKALHLLSMRRIKMENGAVQDVEKLRSEAVRADGVIVHEKGFELEFEDAKSLADMRGQLEMKNAARQEIENFGPNPALVGQGVEAKSGRAIALMQQAGLAELGPFVIAYTGWKKRVYRAVWNAIRQHWTAERWIRVTDQEGQQQSVQINAQQQDPMTGMVQMVNQLGALDVDIIIDEGPDAVNMQADALDVLQNAAAQGQQIPPGVMIELLPLPDSMKRKLLGMIQQAQAPNPAQEQAQQIQLAEGAAKVDERKANATLKMAQAKAVQPEAPQITVQGAGQQGSPLDLAEQAAKIDLDRVRAGHLAAQTQKISVDAALAPQELALKAMADQRRQDASTDRLAARLS